MTAEVSRLPTANEAPLTKARRLRDEARDSAIEVAEMLCAEVSTLVERCGDASALDTLPEGLRDAFRKLAIELDSRNQSILQIMGPTR